MCLYGVNLPVLKGAYDHDLAPNDKAPSWGCEFSDLWAFRYLAICAALGFRGVRIWLCENGEGLTLDRKGQVKGVKAELLESVRVLQDGARLLGLRLYWTLLDGNAWHRNGDALTGLVASDREQARRFAELAAAPIAETLDQRVTFALEVINEPESLSEEVLGEAGHSWSRIVSSVRLVRESLHEAAPGLPITSGTQAIFLPGLFSGVSSAGEAPVDMVDLHVYHPDGGLPSREELPVDIGALPLIAGECGLSHRGEPGRSEYLLHYLHNGSKLGYEAVFLWKLEGEDQLVRRARVPGAPEGTEGFLMTPVGEQVKHLLRGDLE